MSQLSQIINDHTYEQIIACISDKPEFLQEIWMQLSGNQMESTLLSLLKSYLDADDDPEPVEQILRQLAQTKIDHPLITAIKNWHEFRNTGCGEITIEVTTVNAPVKDIFEQVQKGLEISTEQMIEETGIPQFILDQLLLGDPDCQYQSYEKRLFNWLNQKLDLLMTK